MKDIILNFYEHTIFFYSIGLIVSYVLLMWLAEISILRNRKRNLKSYSKELLKNSPYTPGVSIVAPAFNEGLTIVNNVNSLLAQDYPIFEVIIVNDGSKDDTLEKLIKNFDLVEVPYAYVPQLKTKPYRRLFKSTRPEFARLKVVDKENGGTKADAINAGLNVVSYPYFINTDVDCILDKDAIFNCVIPLITQDNVVAVSGSMALSNGCIIKDGKLVEAFPPHKLLPLFQTLEYMRSFLIGKLGWSAINAMPNISGGFGLFRTDIVIAAGGYSSESMAEDMDMMIRVAAYCCEAKIEYKVIQIPFTCCWTEAPASLKILSRQRIRWGRGLLETYYEHRRFIGNRKYKRLGLITMPYLVIFELIAPIIEFFGFFTILYLIFTNSINWLSAVIMFLAIYIFCLLLSIVIIFYDYTLGGSYKKLSSYLWILMAAALEPFIYHPLVVFYSLRGYWNHIRGKKASWGVMTRTGAACIVSAMLCFPINTYAIFYKKNNAETYIKKVSELYRKNNIDSMKIVLDNALNHYPENSELLKWAGAYSLKKQKTENARYFLVKSIKYDSENYEAKMMLVNLEESTGKLSSAICHINEMLEKEPFDRDLWLKKIGLYLVQGNADEGFRLLERLYSIYPNDSIVRNKYINSLEENYIEKKKNGEYTDAEKFLDKFLTYKKNIPELYVELSNIQYKLGYPDKAMSTIDKGISENPGSNLLLMKKASMMVGNNREMEAFYLLGNKNKTAPNDSLATVQYNILWESAKKNRWYDTYSQYARLYDSSKSTEALNYLLDASMSSGYEEDAVYYINEAKKKFGKRTDILYKEYRLYKRQCNNNKAINTLEQITSLYPENKEMRNLLAYEKTQRANNLMMHNMYYDAIQDLQYALTESENNDTEKSLINKLLVCYSQTRNYKAVIQLIDSTRCSKNNSYLYASEKALAQEKTGMEKEALAELESMEINMPLGIYEEISNRYTKKAIENGAIKEAYRNCTQLLKYVPKSKEGIMYAIRTSNVLKKYTEEKEYTLKGRKYYPDDQYFVLRESAVLYRNKMYKEGLALIRPWVDSLSANKEFIDAYSAHTEMLAEQLIKENDPEKAIRIIKEAQLYDESSPVLAFTEGKAYEKLNEYNKAYDAYKKYKPGLMDVKEHKRKLMSVRRKGLNNSISTELLTGWYKNGRAANSVFTLGYGRKFKNDYIYTNINMMSLNKNNEENFSDNTGAQIKVNWTHSFSKRWSAMIDLGLSNRFFPKWSTQLGASFYHPKDIELGISLGYKRNYFFYDTYNDITEEYTNISSTGNMYNLKLSSILYREHWTLNTNCDGYLINHKAYFNINAQGKYFPINDSETYLMGNIGFGTAPEADFVDKMMPNSFDKINMTLGLGCMYMINSNVSVGINGTFHRFYNQSELDGGASDNDKTITGYKDLYNINGMISLYF